MGIFGKDPSSSRNRRNASPATSSSVNSAPVSIVPAPPQTQQTQQNGPFSKSNSNLNGSSSVFGRQQSWSDQVADASILKGAVVKSSGYNYGNVSGTSPSNDVKFVHSTMEILENQIKREEAPKKKRTRTSTEQLRILQKAFQTDPMPNSSARGILSKKLGMSARAVQVWFQNRRAKEKLDSKRNVMGFSGTSSFTYDDDDEEAVDGENDDLDDEEDSGSNGTDSSSGNRAVKSSEIFSSKANGMMGRMAFIGLEPGTSHPSNNTTNNNNLSIKSQRSSSTPNGFFQMTSNNLNQQGRPSHAGYYANTNNSTHNSSSPYCHLFPGETFISNVNEASVDQLYQDLGGNSNLNIPSPIDDTCTVLLSANNNNNNNHKNNINHQIPSAGTSSSSNYFTFGDPFYGGGIIDRTPSVSPVGFGPRSHFYPIGQSFDFMVPSAQSSNEFASIDSYPSSSSSKAINNFSNYNGNTAANNACKGLSGGNVYLTTSIGSNTTSSTSSSAAANSNHRRSFSLPQTHGNLSFQQVQQLENFGMQVFPSPLLSINEEDGGNCSATGSLRQIVNRSNQDIASDIKSSSSPPPNDFLLPFSDFLDGEVIR